MRNMREEDKLRHQILILMTVIVFSAFIKVVFEHRRLFFFINMHVLCVFRLLLFLN